MTETMHTPPSSSAPSELGTTRRGLLRNASLLGASAVASTVLARSARVANAAPAKVAKSPKVKPAHAKAAVPRQHLAHAMNSDLGLLKFALLLEQLEASFYTQVVVSDTATPYLHGRFHDLAPTVRDNETAHVGAIAAAITRWGGTVPAAPQFQFPGEAFISPIFFARFAYTLEEIGVGAYLGALSHLRSDELRRTLVSIYGVEARHAALWRQLGGYEFAPRFYEGALSAYQVNRLIAPYIATSTPPAGPAPAAPAAPAEAAPAAAPAAPAEAPAATTE